MAFIAPKPPQQALDAMHTTFLDLSRNRSFRTPALRNATGTLQLAEPHQVFTLDLTDLVAGKGLDAARPTGWHYLVQEGDNTLASAETVAGPRGEQVFSAFNESRFVDSSAKALRAMDRWVIVLPSMPPPLSVAVLSCTTVSTITALTPGDER